MTTSSTMSADVIVVPLPRPRRCWTLVEDVGEGEWEVAEFDRREAIAVALPTPRWNGRGWEARDAEPLVLTWAPDAHGLECFWVPEYALYWSRAAAARAAGERTRVGSANRSRGPAARPPRDRQGPV